MNAHDIMVSPVVTVKPSTPVRDVAKLFLQRQISAVLVVDEQRKLVGIVSEGRPDASRRDRNGTAALMVAAAACGGSGA
jgi:CBS-domain-containing membrane protein